MRITKTTGTFTLFTYGLIMDSEYFNGKMTYMTIWTRSENDEHWSPVYDIQL